jgi:predicted nucleic-acid-binding Zn-ribbon protein
MKTDACPKCGANDRQHGKIYEKGSLNDIRFKADAAGALTLKKQLIALACSQCGCVEFFLADLHEG